MVPQNEDKHFKHQWGVCRNSDDDEPSPTGPMGVRGNEQDDAAGPGAPTCANVGPGAKGFFRKPQDPPKKEVAGRAGRAGRPGGPGAGRRGRPGPGLPGRAREPGRAVPKDQKP